MTLPKGGSIKPDLSEARRLHSLGYKLCRLQANRKAPAGNGWNLQAVRAFDDTATGYGVLLPANGLCSIDPDNAELAFKMMAALGFDLESIMAAGVRSRSTRPNSGGRSLFKAAEGLGWISFRFKGVGTVLELRAGSPNLQDVVPGLIYKDRTTGALCTQRYANGKRIDDAPDLPADLRDWWHRMSTDLAFKRDQQRGAAEALGLTAQLDISGGEGKELAFKSPYRVPFNERHQVEDLLIAHGYADHGDRFAPPTATGAPGIRLIPGKADLWRSDHASDPLMGTFDAWTANVVLNFEGDQAAAEAAFQAALRQEAANDFRDLAIDPPATDNPETGSDSGGQPANDAPAGEAPAAPHRFKLLTGQDLAALPPLQWLVHGVLPAEGMATIYGPSASGKSFLAFDLSAAVAEGRRWYGHHVKARPVVYLGLEGEAGFRNRAAAWEQHHGRPLPAGFHMVLQPFGLTDPADVRDLAAAILAAGGHGALTIIDTLNRAAPTADENASKDMGLILEGTKALQRLTGGLVLIVHHTGKDLARGFRGHSSAFAALDAAIEVQRDGDARGWSIAKAKDGEDGATRPFKLEKVNLGTDEWGEPITSCVAVPAERTARPAKPLTHTQRVAMDAFERAQGDTLRGVHVEAWRAEFYRASTADTPEAKKKQFQRVRQELVILGRLTVSDDVYHQPGGDDFSDFLDEAGHGT